ncbi:hypothetical protein D3C81_1003650 [compost metagenome]
MAEGEEVVEQFGEQARVLGVIVEQALNDSLHPHMQTVAQSFTPLLPTDRSTRNLVEQAAGRVAGTAEQPFVEQRDLEQRNMQTRDQRPEAGRKVVVVVDVLEQQADQIDHVFIGRGDAPACATAHTYAQQQLFKLLAELEVICRLRGGYIVLQV